MKYYFLKGLQGFALVFALLVGLFLTFLFLWGGMGFVLFLWSLLLGWASVPVASLSLVFGPFAVFFFVAWLADSLRTEALLVRAYGERAALWVDVDRIGGGFVHPGRYLYRYAVLYGRDHSGDSLRAYAAAFNMPQEIQDMFGEGFASLGSISWSRLVLWLERHLDNNLGYGFTLLAFLAVSKFAWKTGSRILARYVYFWFALLSLSWYVPAPVFWSAVFKVLTQVLYLAMAPTATSRLFVLWFKWRVTSIVVTWVAYFVALNTEMERHHSATIAAGSRKLMSHYRAFIMQGVHVLNEMALPSYIRTRGFFGKPTKELLQESLDIMKAIGWPVNVELAEPDMDVPSLSSFKEWVLCGTDFATGIHNMKVYVDHTVDTLRIAGLEYKRTEQYASLKNELEATARYFRSPSYDFPDLDIDDVWFIVGDIFRRSQLTPFNYIIKMWEKRYALGAFMKDPKSNKKMRRSKFISSIGGYAPFKKLWAATFYYASRIIPVSAVSVKGEALPERKYLQDKVRTVIGSPITQYILSTIWNYGPNHRFAWETTPIKIGMPLNGYWMTTVWQQHSRCQVHVQGDFTAFDSTISGRIIDLVKEVRKRGYDHHKDRDRIAQLIDVNYEQVSSQLLNTTSTGNVYFKGTGLTTGHSSTSMDNSLALVIIYLMAWKDLTGLGAREFIHYNELSCFGDDHVLSFLSVRPAVWTPKNIAAIMSKWGLTNRVEVKPLHEIEFLSKFGRRATSAEVASLETNGVKGVRFLVWHNRAKLLGKLTAPLRNANPTYKVKRLLSYLTLTAHHPEIHAEICRILKESRTMASVIRNNALKVPTYAQVLRDWYHPSPGQKPHRELDTEIEEFEQAGQVVQYGAVTALDAFLGALSMVPDALSPLLFNFGYARAVQVFLKLRLAWIPDLLLVANDVHTPGAMAHCVKKTPYRWLETSLHVPGLSATNTTSLLVRHWLFLLYKQFRPAPRWAGYGNFVVRKFNSAQFILNARLMGESRDNEVVLDEIIVAALLSLVSLPDWLRGFKHLRLPDLQLLVDLAWHFLVVTIWSRVPPSFRETTPSLNSLKPGDRPLGIVAATGSGKSTSFIQHVANAVGHKYRRIIVVEPRSLLVSGLATFMENAYGLSVTAGTRNSVFKDNAKVAYVTPQFLISNSHLLRKDSLYILDEAHLDEPFYVLFRRLLPALGLATIFTTATLPDAISSKCGVVVDIVMARLWSIDDQVVHKSLDASCTVSDVLKDYSSYALETANSLAPGEKALLFVPTKLMASRLAESCKWKSLALTADTPVDDFEKWQIFFATPVADVGVTLPGVSLVVTPNFSVLANGGQGLVALSPLLYKQRRGRTGRTNNGICRLVKYDTALLVEQPSGRLDTDTFRSMIFEGLPFELAAKLDLTSALSIFNTSPDELGAMSTEEVVRDISAFLANMKPLFLGSVGERLESADFGDDYQVIATGAGNFQAQLARPTDIANSTIDLISQIVASKAKGSTGVLDLGGFPALTNLAGPIFDLRSMVQNWVYNGLVDISPTLNPFNRVSSGGLKDLYEGAKIAKLLKDFDLSES